MKKASQHNTLKYKEKSSHAPVSSIQDQIIAQSTLWGLNRTDFNFHRLFLNKQALTFMSDKDKNIYRIYYNILTNNYFFYDSVKEKINEKRTFYNKLFTHLYGSTITPLFSFNNDATFSVQVAVQLLLLSADLLNRFNVNAFINHSDQRHLTISLLIVHKYRLLDERSFELLSKTCHLEKIIEKLLSLNPDGSLTTNQKFATLYENVMDYCANQVEYYSSLFLKADRIISIIEDINKQNTTLEIPVAPTSTDLALCQSTVSKPVYDTDYIRTRLILKYDLSLNMLDTREWVRTTQFKKLYEMDRLFSRYKLEKNFFSIGFRQSNFAEYVEALALLSDRERDSSFINDSYQPLLVAKILIEWQQLKSCPSQTIKNFASSLKEKDSDGLKAYVILAESGQLTLNVVIFIEQHKAKNSLIEIICWLGKENYKLLTTVNLEKMFAFIVSLQKHHFFMIDKNKDTLLADTREHSDISAKHLSQKIPSYILTPFLLGQFIFILANEGKASLEHFLKLCIQFTPKPLTMVSSIKDDEINQRTWFSLVEKYIQQSISPSLLTAEFIEELCYEVQHAQYIKQLFSTTEKTTMMDKDAVITEQESKRWCSLAIRAWYIDCLKKAKQAIASRNEFVTWCYEKYLNELLASKWVLYRLIDQHEALLAQPSLSTETHFQPCRWDVEKNELTYESERQYSDSYVDRQVVAERDRLHHQRNERQPYTYRTSMSSLVSFSVLSSTIVSSPQKTAIVAQKISTEQALIKAKPCLNEKTVVASTQATLQPSLPAIKIVFDENNGDVLMDSNIDFSLASMDIGHIISENNSQALLSSSTLSSSLESSHGVGNCLFDAIARQTLFSAGALRQMATNYLKTNAELKEKIRTGIARNNCALRTVLADECYNSVEHYIELMSQNGTWATEIEICALSHVLKRPIDVEAEFNLAFAPHILYGHEYPQDETLYIGYINQNHYVARDNPNLDATFSHRLSR